MQVRKLLALGIAAVLLPAAACRRAARQTAEVVAVPAGQTPLDPEDRTWRDAPEHLARLLLQDLVEPRLMSPSTPEVRVRALVASGQIAFRLEWRDATRDDRLAPGRFVDSCAVQLPADGAPEPPDPQMGQAGRPVEITFWRADWQAWSETRPDDIRELYPQAAVDHYPFRAPALPEGSTQQKEMTRLYAPSEAVGNRRAGPRASPVEDLIAEGPGTLKPAPRTSSRGRGVYSDGSWRVVLVRPLPQNLAPRSRTVVAFAVWEGSHGEAGARKMRTGWIPLLRKEGP